VVVVEDSEAALEKVVPSVSTTRRRRFEALRDTFGGGIGGKSPRKEGKERAM